MGATLKCSFGTTPSSLIVIPKGTPTIIEGKLAATIMDFRPIVNIPSFRMCNSKINPIAPACVPVIPAPWAPGTATFSINTPLALNDSCKCMCAWGGVIQITNPGQSIVSVP
ncbi:DUF4280 domain-containing protein [Myxosarcina sp. GI1]|uniref:DUF4280 domain-containing protein n=1 Tax=Myxosarcina sp. GI1 TaxID=1541065 RepID=UPI0035283F3E